VNREQISTRFSNHENNAVKFGDQLNGRTASRDEILYRLGLKERIFIPETYKSVPTRTIKKKETKNFPKANITMKELYELPDGTDISKYAGMLAGESQNLILPGTITTRVSKDPQGRELGRYVYKDKD
jgi:hypothetical protein